MRRLTWLLLAVALALTAETTVRKDPSTLRDVLLIYAVACALFLFNVRPPEPWPSLGPRLPWRRSALYLTLTGVLLGLAAWVGFWQRPDVYTGWPFVFWLLGTALLLVGAWWDGRGRPLENPFPPRPTYGLRAPLSRRTEWGLLALIVLVGLFLRTWQLDQIPYGCQSDECNNAMDALRWLQGEPYQPFVGTNEGQATLFTYLIAALFALLGPDMLSLRLAPALVGTLTLPAFYLLARWRFDSPRLALILTGLLAASRWHITFSRIVYELIMVPLVVSLLLLVLLRALRHGRRHDWALVGFFLALGLNTYTAFRVVPFWMALFFLYWLIGDWVHPMRRAQLRRDVEGMVLAVGTFVLALGPLGVYMIRNWDQFTARIRHISVMNDVARVGSYEPVWQNLRKALLMFNVQGDMAPINNLPGAPLLDVVTGALLVLGMAYALRYFNRPLPFLYVTGMVLQLTLVVLTVAHEAPSARRPIAALVLIYLLVGEVLAQVWTAFDRAWRAQGQRAWQVAMAVVVAWALVTNGHTYFNVQAQRLDVQLAFSPNEFAVGKYIRTLPDDVLVYVTRAYFHHSAVRFVGGREVIPLNLARHVPLREQVARDVVYILDPPLERVIPFLQKVYPEGEAKVHRGPGEVPLFISFRVPAESMANIRGLRAIYTPGLDPTRPPALEELTSRLDLDFRENSPLAPPWTVTFVGAVLVPQVGEYTFRVEVDGEASLYLDNREVLRVTDGTAEVRYTTVAGFLPFRLVYQATSAPGYVRVMWGLAGQSLQVLSVPDIYAIDIGPNGLIGYYYPNPDWSGPPSYVSRDFFILPNNILREPYSIRWRGKIAIPVTGTYRFATLSDDGSYVYINGQLVVDNGGVHGLQRREGSIFLEAGFHDLEVRYFQQIGASAMTFLWTPPGGREEIVPLEYLYPYEDEVPTTVPVPSISPPVSPPEETPPVGGPLSDLGLVPRWTVGECGVGEGAFRQPRGIAAAPDGRLFVADTGNQRIVVLGPDGSFVKAWGEAGEGPGQFVEPVAVAVAPDGTVWVLDAVRQVLLRFSPDGQFRGEVIPESPWYRPRGFTLAPDGSIYVADTGGARITRIAVDGRLLAQIGGPQEVIGPGQPTDVALAPDGTLYVVEAATGTVWHLDAEGQPLQRWFIAEASTVDGPHLAVTSSGEVLVTSPATQAVHWYTATGGPIGRWGSPEWMSLPVGIALTPSGQQVLVVDSGGCRVLAYDLP